MSQELDKKNEKREKRNRTFAYISLYTGLVPILLFLQCYIASGGSLDESSDGAVWWAIPIYYFTIGIPLLIISIVFALFGLKSSKKNLALISLLITFLPFIILFIIIALSTIIYNCK